MIGNIHYIQGVPQILKCALIFLPVGNTGNINLKSVQNKLLIKLIK